MCRHRKDIVKTHKFCTKCQQTLPADSFKLRGDNTLAAYCFPCFKIYQQEYSKKNSAKKTQAALAWAKSNPDRRREIGREWGKKNYDPSKVDKAKALERYRKWRAENIDKAHENERRYRQRNPETTRYSAALRRTNIRQPKWFGEFDSLVIKEAYRLAGLRKETTGFSWHVDHIVPIKGATVSGLHCANNIAVIPWIDNLLKSNKAWPCMPDPAATV